MEKTLENFWQEKRAADDEYNKTQNKYYEGVSDAMLYCINEIQHSTNVHSRRERLIAFLRQQDKLQYITIYENDFEFADKLLKAINCY